MTDPLAPFRDLAAHFEQIAQEADDSVEKDNYPNEEARFALRCTATAWRYAARLMRQTLDTGSRP